MEYLGINDARERLLDEITLRVAVMQNQQRIYALEADKSAKSLTGYDRDFILTRYSSNSDILGLVEAYKMLSPEEPKIEHFERIIRQAVEDDKKIIDDSWRIGELAKLELAARIRRERGI